MNNTSSQATQKKNIKFSINGRNFSIECNSNEKDRVDSIIQYLIEEIEYVKKKARYRSDIYLFLLASINIVDKYFELQKRLDKYDDSFVLSEGERDYFFRVLGRVHSIFDNICVAHNEKKD